MSEEGLTARKAAWRVYGPPAEEDPPPTFQLFAGGMTWVDAEYDEHLSLQAALMEALRKGGIFRVEGYQHPLTSESKRKAVPDLWDVLEVDIDANTAEAAELKYSGLCFFEATVKRRKTSKSEATYLVELTELLRKKRFTTKTKLKDDATNREVVSGKGFDRCWKKAMADPTTDPSWGSTGPVSTKS